MEQFAPLAKFGVLTLVPRRTRSMKVAKSAEVTLDRRNYWVPFDAVGVSNFRVMDGGFRWLHDSAIAVSESIKTIRPDQQGERSHLGRGDATHLQACRIAVRFGTQLH